MNKKNAPILLSLFILFFLSVFAGAQAQKKNQYTNIEVLRFEVKGGIDFPPDYLTGLVYETIMALEHLRKFQHVLREGESQSDVNAPTLRLIGTVTKYQAGSRTKRYVIGFGVGKTKVVAHIKFIDKATGEVRLEKDVDGRVIMGYFGGDSKGALHGVGKKIAEATKKQFF